MEYRFLGGTGLKVSVLSFGGWIKPEDDVFKQCVIESWNNGINYFDTAEGYEAGKCETAFGKIFKDLDIDRSSLVISTKIYFGDATPNHPNAKGLSRKHIIEGLDKSLQRLQLDYVDVVFAHRPDALTPMEEVVRAFTKIINDGKAHYWGTSEWSAFEIENAYHVADKYGLIPPIADQPQYSLLVRDRVEAEYRPLYKLYSYGNTIWSPLKGGILTGKYNDGIPKGTRYDTKDPLLKSFAERLSTPEGKAEIEKVKKLQALAKELGTDAATLSVAWVIYNKNVSTAILGASRPEQVTNNLKALDVYRKLDDKTVEKIEKIFENTPPGLNLYGRWA